MPQLWWRCRGCWGAKGEKRKHRSLEEEQEKGLECHAVWLPGTEESPEPPSGLVSTQAAPCVFGRCSRAEGSPQKIKRN